MKTVAFATLWCLILLVLAFSQCVPAQEKPSPPVETRAVIDTVLTCGHCHSCDQQHTAMHVMNRSLLGRPLYCATAPEVTVGCNASDALAMAMYRALLNPRPPWWIRYRSVDTRGITHEGWIKIVLDYDKLRNISVPWVGVSVTQTRATDAIISVYEQQATPVATFRFPVDIPQGLLFHGNAPYPSCHDLHSHFTHPTFTHGSLGPCVNDIQDMLNGADNGD